MKRFFLLLLAAILPVASCGGSSRPGADTIVIAIEQDPGTLDPRIATTAYASRLCGLLFDGLMKLDPNGRLTPDLAERYESPDARTFIFHLRDGVHFHDGKPFTSADVAFTVRSILDPTLRSPKFGAFKEVSTIETPDPRTVVFRLKRPFSPFLTATMTGIVPEGLSGKSPQDFARAPVGTGPFRFKSWEANARIALDANAAYFGGAPKIPHAIFKVIPNDATRVLELRKGSVDLIQNAVPAYSVRLLREDPGVRIVERPGVNFSYLGFNLEDPILKKREVRAAIAHAIDRDAIIRNVLEGLATPAKGLLAPSNWAYAGDVETYDHDPAKARALLDRAGFPDPDGPGPRSRFRLTYKTSTIKERVIIGEVIVQQLREVGIDVKLQSLEWGTFYSDVNKGNFQLYGMTWVGVTDPDQLHYAFHSSNVPPALANRGRYRNPEVDTLLDRAREITDEGERKKLYAQAQRILAHDLPYVPLWYSTDIAAMRRRLVGYELYPSGDFTGLVGAHLETAGGKR
jgi:peptide/nickel transport system substrate-binding protein